MNKPQITKAEARAVGLYAVLARDVSDFFDMVAEPQDIETLHTLAEMLALLNEKHDEATKSLNELGLGIVKKRLKFLKHGEGK